MRRPPIKRLVRFVLAGLCVTGIHVLIATFSITYLGIGSAIANSIAFLAATLVSYLINTLWSFRKPLAGRSLLRFGIVSAIGLLGAYLIAREVEALGYHYLVGICAIAVTVPTMTFALHNLWTYR